MVVTQVNFFSALQKVIADVYRQAMEYGSGWKALGPHSICVYSGKI